METTNMNPNASSSRNATNVNASNLNATNPNASLRTILLARDFTPEQIAGFRALRAGYERQDDLIELGLDLKRLEFVRYLVAQGTFNEGTAEA